MTNRVYAFRSPDPLGTWLRRLLGAQIVFTTFTAVDGYLRWRTASFVVDLGDRARPPELPAWQPPVGGAVAPLVTLATIIVWLTWQHRVTANVWARGTPIRTTPGWAVGWWWFPVAAAFMPPIVVARVYRAVAEQEEHQHVVPLVVAWWLAYLLLPIIAGAVAATKLIEAVSRLAHASEDVARVDLTPYFRTASTWTLWLLPVSIAAGVLAITLVTNIDRAQERLAARVPPRPDLL